jgi:hypothetical protein
MIGRTACTLGMLALGAAAAAQEARSIALVLDASGSMNAALGGGTRLDAAKAAVADFVAGLDPAVRLSYRAYGHQSPREAHDCQDTELLVGFDAAGANRDAVLAATRDIRAQGYTPITTVITLAAEEVGREPGEHAVVLVSDGKETCDGDPCAAAKALAAADAELVIHVIGFNADAAARYQLQCIAEVARGTYTDASGADDLGAALGELAAAPPPPETTTAITLELPKPGRLQVNNLGATSYPVTNAETGEEVASFGGVVSAKELPAGLYNVGFGPTVWKSVEVRPGETTVLDPGILEVRNAMRGHKVLDWETGTELGELGGVNTRLTVLPSTFSVTFGGIAWEHIEVEAGEHVVLNPAIIAVTPAPPQGARIVAANGTEVGRLAGVNTRMPVPPGKYTVEIAGQKVPLDLAEGQLMEIKLQ